MEQDIFPLFGKNMKKILQLKSKRDDSQYSDPCMLIVVLELTTNFNKFYKREAWAYKK